MRKIMKNLKMIKNYKKFPIKSVLLKMLVFFGFYTPLFLYFVFF